MGQQNPKVYPWSMALLFVLSLGMLACARNAASPNELGRHVADAHLKGSYGIIQQLMATDSEIDTAFGSAREIAIAPKSVIDRHSVSFHRESARSLFEGRLTRLRPLAARFGEVGVIAENNKFAHVGVGLQTRDPQRFIWILIYAYRAERGWVILSMT